MWASLRGGHLQLSSAAAFGQWSRQRLHGRLEARVAYTPVRHFKDDDLPFLKPSFKFEVSVQ